MPTFRLAVKAISDLKSIALYTQDKWGREQRNKYLRELDECFRMLTMDPKLGRSCDEILPGYRKYHLNRHLVFYRESEEGILIIRILHDRMDIESHL
jgi:toxin ParE1/3/4